jgi:hypothetical protein
MTEKSLIQNVESGRAMEEEKEMLLQACFIKEEVAVSNISHRVQVMYWQETHLSRMKQET